MGIRSTIAWVSTLAYVILIPDIIAKVSFAVAALPAVLFVAVAGTHEFVDRLPKPPTSMYVMMAFGFASLGVHHTITQSSGLLLQIGSGAVGVGVGLLGYFIGFVSARMIGASILGVDLEKMQQEKKEEETGDPYGDPHAARILNEDEKGEQHH